MCHTYIITTLNMRYFYSRDKGRTHMYVFAICATYNFKQKTDFRKCSQDSLSNNQITRPCTEIGNINIKKI